MTGPELMAEAHAAREVRLAEVGFWVHRALHVWHEAEGKAHAVNLERNVRVKGGMAHDEIDAIHAEFPYQYEDVEVLLALRDLFNEPNARVEYDFPVGTRAEIVGPVTHGYRNIEIGKIIVVTGGTIGQRDTYPGMVWGKREDHPTLYPAGHMPYHLKKL